MPIGDHLDVHGKEYLWTSGVSVGFPIPTNELQPDERLLAAVVRGRWELGARDPGGVVLILPTHATPYFIQALLDGYLTVATTDDRAGLLADLMDAFDGKVINDG